jgi:hypothetical protein
VQRRSAKRGALRRGLLSSRRNARLIRGTGAAVSCRYAGRHERRSARPHHRGHRRHRVRYVQLLEGFRHGNDDASKQALADASERYTAASSQIEQATTARQAALAKESAIEGLYYVRAARTAMGMDPGPELESLSGQRSAGAVTEDRRINFEGREIEASPAPSPRTPNYYPGGRVAGRPVPAGWY